MSVEASLGLATWAARPALHRCASMPRQGVADSPDCKSAPAPLKPHVPLVGRRPAGPATAGRFAGCFAPAPPAGTPRPAPASQAAKRCHRGTPHLRQWRRRRGVTDLLARRPGRHDETGVLVRNPGSSCWGCEDHRNCSRRRPPVMQCDRRSAESRSRRDRLRVASCAQKKLRAEWRPA